jgi:glycosyltransferase involved in cell wall biosynthesis
MIYFVTSEVNRSDQISDLITHLFKKSLQISHFHVGKESDLLYLHSVETLNPRDTKLVAGKSSRLIAFAKLFKHLFINRVDVIVASGRIAGMLSMPIGFMLRVPTRIFIRHHADFNHVYGSFSSRFLDRFTLLTSTKIVAVSNLVKDILVTQENIRENKVEVIYNGIRLEEYTSDNSQKRISFCSHRWRIGSIGRDEQLKGIHHIESAVRTLQSEGWDICWSHIYGGNLDQGSHNQYLTHNIESTINKYGYCEDIIDFYRSVDFFVHIPIRKTAESFGLVFIESLAIVDHCFFTRSGILSEVTFLDDFYTEVCFDTSADLYTKLRSRLVQLSDSPVSREDSLKKNKALHVFSMETALHRFERVLESD